MLVQANYLSCSFHLTANHVPFVAGYLGVDICALDALMTQPVLHSFLALASVKHVHGDRMPQGMSVMFVGG